ncbi:MAG: rRNA maturation RNAse YbeY [Patescibacteria group bacterium]
MVDAKFNKIKEYVLGKRYDLSVAFLTAPKMRAVTKKTKGTNHVSNVLSFPLSKTSGEILICKSAAKPFTVEYLFIHGLCHLKGLKHGASMEAKEAQILKKFGLRQYAINSNRHRRRLASR